MASDLWFRASLNLSLEHFDDDCSQATTATYPRCATVIDLGTVIVMDDVRTVAR